MTVLVTGGNGFVGKHLKLLMPDWVYVSSKDFDLTNENETRKMFSTIKPKKVVHLAAKVGGIKDNSTKQAEYFEKNVLINTNVVKCAKDNKVQRLLACLSTCAFPDILKKYPFDETAIFEGPPAETNLSYGFSKRMLHIHCSSIRKQYGLNYSTFCPSNIYGPGDHFGKEDSHFVASLLYKIKNAKNGDNIEFWGTGNPKRQHLYVEDLCKIIPLILENHNCDLPLIVAPQESLTIKEAIDISIEVSGKKIKYYFNNNLDGQLIKDGNNAKLIEKIGNFRFTTFREGFKKTYNSF